MDQFSMERLQLEQCNSENYTCKVINRNRSQRSDIKWASVRKLVVVLMSSIFTKFTYAAPDPIELFRTSFKLKNNPQGIESSDDVETLMAIYYRDWRLKIPKNVLENSDQVEQICKYSKLNRRQKCIVFSNHF